MTMNPDPMSGAFDMFRAMAACAEAFNTFAMGSAADASHRSPTGTDDERQRMLQVYLAVANSGYRYLGRWAEISAKRYPELVRMLTSMNADPGARGSELGATMDSVRGFLREMAELPLEESKRLQTEIAAIMGTGKPASDAPKSPPRRRARAKE